MNYTKLSEMARKKCKQFGAICSLVKVSSAYNSETHEAVDVETVHGGYGIVSTYDEMAVNGSTILLGDMRVTFTPHTTANPVTGDLIELNSKRYSIVNVNPLSPNGSTVIMYELQVRA